ncbi:MAG TPA: LacI family DNA-binding transcriptional regulator [Roseiflexaceae bacterium]|nr:LacI family DNA-binding transcriptional regulator [Roseiflexaceae bacterium]
MLKVTIYDVAKRAGVGTTTVSRVLNSPDTVAAETRERVLAAIDELGFVPKFEALVRARKQLRRIGILTPFVTSASFTEQLNGIRAALTEQPFELVIYDFISAAQGDALLTKIVLTHMVDGLIVAFPFGDAAARRLETHRLPLVQRTLPNDPRISTFASIVSEDMAVGGRMAAEYLLERGHRRLGFVGDSGVPGSLVDTSAMKLDGFRQRLAEAGVSLPDAYVGRAPFGMEQACEQARHLLKLPQPPTAIFAASDTQAIGVLRAARECGIAVPAELAVMGFDDVEIAEFIGLTTIAQGLKDSGRLAVQLLLAQFAEDVTVPQRIDLPFTLIRRETA